MRNIFRISFLIILNVILFNTILFGQNYGEIYIDRILPEIHHKEMSIHVRGSMDISNINYNKDNFTVLFFVKDLNSRRLRACFSSNYKIYKRGSQVIIPWDYNLSVIGEFSNRFKLYGVAIANANHYEIDRILRATDDEFYNIESILKILYNYNSTPIAYTYLNY